MNAYETEHLAYLRKHLAECVVLLKTNGDFPLEAAGRIAAYGSGVRNTVKGGTGSGEVNSRYFVNVADGLKNAGFVITTDKWLDAYEQVRKTARRQFIKEIKAEAKAAKVNLAIYGMGRIMPEPEYDLPLDAEGDVAIYVLSRISGEGNDRNPIAGDIKLTETEKRDILALNKKYKKFMLVINAGGVVDLSEVQEVGNILVLSQLGVETGDVLADVLLGKANPSGKLTTTWSAWEDYANFAEFGDNDDTRYNEGIYVGYRYFDTVGKKALYPFGYGVSYTEFALHTDEVLVENHSVNIKVTAKNTGRVAGKEVVQVYVSAPTVRLDKPYQELVGFVKTEELAPNDSQQVVVTFDVRDLASFDEENAVYLLEAGNYIVRVGNSSVHTHAQAVLKLEEDVVVTQARLVLGKTDFADWKPENQGTEEAENLPVILIDADAIKTENVVYEQTYPIDDNVRELTDEQLVLANIGAFDRKGGMLSIIGNASINVAGAAGESTGELCEQGFKAMVMADGPAGLRLSPQFYRDEKGAHGIGQSGIPESVLEFMPLPLQLIANLLNGSSSKAPKNVKVEDQYATALPIGTALAQSWNLEFTEQCGDIVGDEMERFGVHLWLAPALNIHRTIRCGRNFEYYSEDPFVSGKFAAAITRGVQKHAGCGTTIKHYAANNQENNRYGNNSMVSERAMREIYLKGFGICVKEAQPHALMTSYNLLNGTHTAEHRGLIEDILRCEYGYQGIVMTDWQVGGGVMNKKDDKYAAVKPYLTATAGSNLFMPGCKGDYDDMMKAVAEGKLERKQLQINATRVKRMAEKLVK